MEQSGQRHTLGGEPNTLPTYLRLALEKFADDEGRNLGVHLRIVRLTLECEKQGAQSYRTHQDFGPRLPRSHSPGEMRVPPGMYDPRNDIPPYDPDHGD